MSVKILVGYTDRQYELLRKAAFKYKTTVTNYCRSVCLASVGLDYKDKRYKQLALDLRVKKGKK